MVTFLQHPVHGGLAIVDLPHLVNAAGVKEDAFRHCGLPRVYMRDNSYVACFGEFWFRWHLNKISLPNVVFYQSFDEVFSSSLFASVYFNCC